MYKISYCYEDSPYVREAIVEAPSSGLAIKKLQDVESTDEIVVQEYKKLPPVYFLIG